MVPKAGGEYEYLGLAFGDLPAFLFIWAFIVVIIPASCAFSALLFADYILQPFYDGCESSAQARFLISACGLCKMNY
jgi:amino acid transporter